MTSAAAGGAQVGKVNTHTTTLFGWSSLKDWGVGEGGYLQDYLAYS